MNDILQFSGEAQKIIVERAPIQRGTFSDREGPKESILEAEYNRDGSIKSITYPDKIENYVYMDDELICIHVAKLDKNPIYKEDYYYEAGLLVKKTRVNELGIVDEEETYYYNSSSQMISKNTKTMTYEYEWQDDLLIEERWSSELSVNHIIRYKYKKNQPTEILHLSGDEIPGRKVEYRYNSSGFIQEEIVYSASNLVISHIKYEYHTTFKHNWLKRTKYLLNGNNRRKEAIEVQYRDFKFYPSTKIDDIQAPEVDTPGNVDPSDLYTAEYSTTDVQSSENETTNSVNYMEIEFDNGLYKGETLDGEMHGAGDFIFNTGTRYQGNFAHNVMHGKGKLTYISGKVYEGTFKNNVLEGPGACKWENGDFYVGEFKSGKMHGRGCYIWNNGNRFEGMFENNRRTEQGILYKKEELDSDAPPEWVNELFK